MANKKTLKIIAGIVIGLVILIAALSIGSSLVNSFGSGRNTENAGGNETAETPNKLPTAILNADSYVSREGDAVSFDGNESFDVDYTGNLSNKGIFLFEWNFDDGSDPYTTQNGTEIHTFNDQGIYDVVLTVYDEDGASDSDNVTIEVVPKDTFISSGTKILIGEPLVPGVGVIPNSTQTNWTVKKNARYMEINVSVTGFYAEEVSKNHVDILLYDPWEDVIANTTIEVMGSKSINWEFDETQISVPGEYYVFIQCSKGAAFVTVQGQVSYLLE